MAFSAASRLILTLVTVLSCSAVGAAAPDLPRWFDAAASTRANAGNAQRDGAAAADASRVLTQNGDDPAHVVSAVIDAYNRCDAVYDSVRTTSQLAPDRTSDIVQAAASTSRCPCGGEALWQRSRLEQRIRIEQRRNPVLVAPLCGCAATAAEAAVAVAPDRADAVLEAALGAGRRAGAVVDSMGRIGDIRGPAAGAAGMLVRREQQRCARDVVAEDEFKLGQLWQAGQLNPDDLQNTTARCADPSDDDSTADSRRNPGDMVLAGYVADGRNRALVLFNGSSEAVELGSDGYQLDLYFPENTEVGRRIQLTGKVPKDSHFVIAARGSDAAWLARADQIVDGSLLTPSEAVVLRRGVERNGCDCAVAGVAGMVNGLGAGPGGDWLTEQTKAAAGVRAMSTADRVGQIRPETFARDEWRAPLAPAPLLLSRQPGECAAERRAEAPFIPGTPWTQVTAPATGFDANCAATPNNLLLSRLSSWAPESEGGAPQRALEIFNGTGVEVDLAAEGYALDVYADGARDPAQVVALEGKLAHGAVLRVVTGRAPEEVRSTAAVISDDLAQRSLDAVVLRRISTGVGGVCRADVYAAAVEVGAPPIVIAARPDASIEGEPRTDESPIDPDRGGDVASPN